MRVARVKEGERFCVAQEEWGELEQMDEWWVLLL